MWRTNTLTPSFPALVGAAAVRVCREGGGGGGKGVNYIFDVKYVYTLSFTPLLSSSPCQFSWVLLLSTLSVEYNKNCVVSTCRSNTVSADGHRVFWERERQIERERGGWGRQMRPLMHVKCQKRHHYLYHQHKETPFRHLRVKWQRY